MIAHRYTHEALLREPFEYVAAWTYWMAAGILLVGSELAFVIPSVAYACAAIFTARGIQRWREGRFVRRYQHNLTRLPLYTMKSSQLPKSITKQFLGMGFRWTGVHAQRIYTAELPRNAKFVQLSRGYRWARGFVYRHETHQRFQTLTRFLESQSRYNPWKPQPDLEGRAYLHAVGMPEGEETILQPLSTRVAHTLVLGTTRVGKTRLAEILVTQDIHRGDVVIVFDPKGDQDLLLRMYAEAKKAGREDQFYMFHLGYPDQSAQYNPVGSFLRVTEVATRIANQMPGEGQSLAFREFVWGFVNQIAKGLVLLGRTPSYPTIKIYAQDVEPLFVDVMRMLFEQHAPGYRTRLEQIQRSFEMKAEDRRKAGFDVTLPRAMNDRGKEGKGLWLLFRERSMDMPLSDTERDVGNSLMKAFATDSGYMAKLVASLDPFLEKMTTGAVSKLIAPNFEDPEKDVFSWSQIIQSGGIVYVGLDALSDAEVAATVGNSMFADLTSVAGRLYKHGSDHGLPQYSRSGYRPKICLHADEFNELCGPEFVPMLNKAGGAGVQVTAYTQTLSDLEARIGMKAKAEQMLGNFNSLIMLRVLNETTARILTEKQQQVNVSHLATFSGAADNSDITSDVQFTSSTQSREITQVVDLLRVSDLSQLPKGHAFALLDGGNLYKLRIPFLSFSRAENIPQDISYVADEMRARYHTIATDWNHYNEYLNVPQVVNDGAEDNFYQTMLDDITRLGESEISDGGTDA